MDEIGLLSVLGFGLLLGIKHAIEPDHVIAVSTIATRTKRLWQSTMTGVFWGIGHTLTLFLLGMIVILMKEEIPESWAVSLEAVVGVMLIYFGITTMISFKKFRTSRTTHSSTKKSRSYGTSIFMGFIHGLAGSAALILLTLSSVNSLAEGAMFILTFGVGTIIGMLLFTTLIGLPFVMTTKKLSMNKAMTQIAGIISTVYGIYYLSSIYFG
ncbi:urease accessory protein UreH domain-containing protein [Halobacillus mangrovi]|uniref:Urease accessory protein UreH n=1 Tax=Halobacillus mangrovi TaxID=402384 RepID=A0A1W5ZZK4_9BACI|nr:sulfite exporter TauE/SafE family protein [Halobacillus mangrovi]ARI78699.1 urease accessory protein UreH [Halobacillus mangrovi]